MHGCINAKLLLSPPPKASVQLIDSLNLQLYAVCLNLVFILMSMPTAGSPSSDFWAKSIRLFEAKTLHLHFWERGIIFFFFKYMYAFSTQMFLPFSTKLFSAQHSI